MRILLGVMKKLLILALAVVITVCAVIKISVSVAYYNSKERIYDKTYEVYKNLIRQTGQLQDTLPLKIVESEEENAYNDGTKIVIYTGLLFKLKTWDEVALILGHEIAHGMLGHLNTFPPVPESTNNDPQLIGLNGITSVLEANADKMGAFYMMKAGYDICKGREAFKDLKERYGDYTAQNHPDLAYRYDQLNVNCGE